MTTRTNSKMVTFARPFLLKEVDRILEAGDYRVVTDEELVEGLSFPVYRRVSTMIFVPGQNASLVEMVAIDPQELQAAQESANNSTPKLPHCPSCAQPMRPVRRTKRFGGLPELHTFECRSCGVSHIDAS
jgi:hypothetical protein